MDWFVNCQLSFSCVFCLPQKRYSTVVCYIVSLSVWCKLLTNMRWRIKVIIWSVKWGYEICSLEAFLCSKASEWVINWIPTTYGDWVKFSSSLKENLLALCGFETTTPCNVGWEHYHCAIQDGGEFGSTVWMGKCNCVLKGCLSIWRTPQQWPMIVVETIL